MRMEAVVYASINLNLQHPPPHGNPRAIDSSPFPGTWNLKLGSPRGAEI